MPVLRVLVAVVMVLVGFGMSTSVDARGRAPTRIRSVEAHEFDDAIVAISGSVTSTAARCLGGRRVTIVETARNIAYGSATTESSGSWAVEGFGAENVSYRITVAASGRCGGDTVVLDLG